MLPMVEPSELKSNQTQAPKGEAVTELPLENSIKLTSQAVADVARLQEFGRESLTWSEALLFARSLATPATSNL